MLSLYGLYFTPVFDELMRTWWGHNLMLVHFVVIGFLYFWGVLGVDPNPRNSRSGPFSMPGPAVSVIEVVATAPFHAFFGVVVMMATTLLVHFYAMPMPGWHIVPIVDQRTGGGIAWTFTEIPTLLVLGALIVNWRRSDERSTRAAEPASWRAVTTRNSPTTTRYLQALARADGVQRVKRVSGRVAGD